MFGRARESIPETSLSTPKSETLSLGICIHPTPQLVGGAYRWLHAAAGTFTQNRRPLPTSVGPLGTVGRVTGKGRQRPLEFQVRLKRIRAGCANWSDVETTIIDALEERQVVTTKACHRFPMLGSGMRWSLGESAAPWGNGRIRLRHAGKRRHGGHSSFRSVANRCAGKSPLDPIPRRVRDRPCVGKHQSCSSPHACGSDCAVPSRRSREQHPSTGVGSSEKRRSVEADR